MALELKPNINQLHYLQNRHFFVCGEKTAYIETNKNSGIMENVPSHLNDPYKQSSLLHVDHVDVCPHLQQLQRRLK